MHLAGGSFIALGFRTRVMVLSQLPIFMAALSMLTGNSRLIVWEPFTEFVVLSVCILLSIVYLIHGSGQMSIDTMKKHKM